MKIEQYVCDQCGARKGESNHWYCLREEPRGYPVFYLTLLEHETAGVHLCSDKCAMKKLSIFLGENH